MSRIRYTAAWHGSLLVLAGLASVEAQYPAPRDPTRSTTSAVGQLPLHDSAFAPPTTGTLRELLCRGGEGMQVTVKQDPSPRSASQVAVTLAYRRNSKPVGSAYENLEPGACSWNLTNSASIPAEPGIVYFDIDRQGHEYSPDPATLPIYLSNSRHYWVFYVDDVTHVSPSHGAYGGRFRVDSTRAPPRKSSATALRRERLRCRGGGTGLAFARGSRTGANEVAMTLKYRVAFSPAGPIGGGLEPGTCAWADRTDAREEPGSIEFTTAGNAQLKQIQSGSEVDRSPTAAERWPDVHTIPAYMNDPAHFWTFTVSLATPVEAIRHSAWRPSIPENIASTPPSSAPTTVESSQPGSYNTDRSTTSSVPGIIGGGERRGDAEPTSSIGTLQRLHDVTTSTMLETATVRFVARPGSRPTVRFSTSAPVDEPGTGYKTFTGSPLQAYVHETSQGVASAYTAVPQVRLERGTRYYYIIDVPGDGGRVAREQQVGEVRTLRQTAEVVFTEIYIVSDGDSDGAGDLEFTFKAGDVTRTLGQDDGNVLQWNDGSRNPISMTIVGLTADRIRIDVSGVDDDRTTGSGQLPSAPCTTSYSPVGANQHAEWNCARTEVDLSQHPGTATNVPLYFRSMPLREGSKLMFDVRGYVTVTRQ